MAENLPRYAVTDLIARVSGMSRGRLETVSYTHLTLPTTVLV